MERWPRRDSTALASTGGPARPIPTTASFRPGCASRALLEVFAAAMAQPCSHAHHGPVDTILVAPLLTLRQSALREREIRRTRKGPNDCSHRALYPAHQRWRLRVLF
jgi:hypothetical protein